MASIRWRIASASPGRPVTVVDGPVGPAAGDPLHALSIASATATTGTIRARACPRRPTGPGTAGARSPTAGVQFGASRHDQRIGVVEPPLGEMNPGLRAALPSARPFRVGRVWLVEVEPGEQVVELDQA